MKKTGSTFEKEVYRLLSDSELKTAISGDIYREGMRPFNSDKEDAVISFLAGTDGQIQIGTVNVNVYVPDIQAGVRKKVKDVKRCNEVEEVCQRVSESLKLSGFLFSTSHIIQTFPEPEIEQHFVNMKLNFKYVTF